MLGAKFVGARALISILIILPSSFPPLHEHFDIGPESWADIFVVLRMFSRLVEKEGGERIREAFECFQTRGWSPSATRRDWPMGAVHFGEARPYRWFGQAEDCLVGFFL